jgi:hypothetical protein
MTDEKSCVFRSDQILETVLATLRECAKSRGYGVSMESLCSLRHLPLYATKLLAFFDVMQNALHIDASNTAIRRVLSSPGHHIDEALHYFTSVRSILEPETCWIYIEFIDRSVYVYMTIRNTNVEERISKDGTISYINLLDRRTQ